jgi:hypothetical protein
MSLKAFLNGLVCALAIAGLGAIGCNTQPAGDGEVSSADEGGEHADHHDEHGEWWCAEHGVPEEVCALCDTKLAAEFQEKGDWCEMHNRPDSQCFICHPELEAKFAAQYEAKYGKKPPKPEL